MKAFEVRDPDYDDGWKKITCASLAEPKDAAETFAESVHGQRDFFKECDLEVREASGHVTRWTVVVESVPQFRARERE